MQNLYDCSETVESFIEQGLAEWLTPLPFGEKASPPVGWNNRFKGKPMNKEGHIHYLREETQNQNINLGFRIPPACLVIDVDIKEKQGDKSFNKLTELFPELKDLEPNVKSPGGVHYYLKLSGDLNLRKNLPELPNIDFLTIGTYVVTGGSKHPSGGYYHTMHNAWTQAPEGLEDFLEGFSGTPTLPPPEGEAGGWGCIDNNDLEMILNTLDPTKFSGRDEWIKLAMICHYATAGRGLEAFSMWCSLAIRTQTLECRYFSDSW